MNLYDDLSKKQKEILVFIKKYMVKNGKSPSVRDIASNVGLRSPATVHVHLQNLISKGFIKRSGNQFKSLELLVPNEFEHYDEQSIRVPFLDSLLVDDFLKELKDPNDFFYLSAQMIPKGSSVFVLSIPYDIPKFSYYQGDYLIVDLDSSFKNQDIVISINQDNQLVIDTSIMKGATVLGKVVGLYREY